MSKQRIMITRPISSSFGAMELVFSNVVLLKKYSLSFEHCHSCFELHLVTRGKSIVHVDGERYPVSEGQLCWINPGVRRYIEDGPEGDSEHFVVHFEFMPREEKDMYSLLELKDIYYLLALLKDKKIWISADNNRCMSIFNFIITELDKKSFGHMLVIRNMLCSFVIEAIQNIGIQELNHGDGHDLENFNIAYGILSYIRNHYTENLTIENVAKELNISTRHLTRLLKDTFGTTFKSSLDSFRIAHVQDRLLNSRDSMEKIAESTGFSCASAMAGCFKKFTGRSLQEYRKNESRNGSLSK